MAEQTQGKEQQLKQQADKLKSYEAKLKSDEDSLKKIREDIETEKNALNKKQTELDRKELEAKNNFPQIFEEQHAGLIDNLNKRITEYNQREVQLRQRETDIREKEAQLDQELQIIRSGISEDRTKFEESCSEKRQALGEELENKRKEHNQKYEALALQLEKEISDKRLALDENVHKALEDEIEKHRETMERDEEKLTKAINEYTSKNATIEAKIQQSDVILESHRKHLEEEFQKRDSLREDEIQRMGDCLKDRDRRILSLKWLEYLEQRVEGHSIESLMKELDETKKDKDRYKEFFAQAPSEDIKEDYDRISTLLREKEAELKELKEEIKENKEKIEEYDEVKWKCDYFKKEAERFESYWERLNTEVDALNGELQRLRGSLSSSENRDERISAIEGVLYIKEPRTEAFDEDLDEITWLENIRTKSENFGLIFPQRILEAFHTSLKIADMSPITVLAGVSGTGKSELPRLYSAFGGINFLNMPVQPNWDSPESMLGFFNSIDNRFDAQPVLNFLAQAASNENTPQSLGKQMNLILLDEMNLAHIELYFADFLSKFEERRGRTRGHEPYINIKLGSGVAPYELRLTRNVLWVGTMNQDETTKSLSDKVLDRGILINFPRPTQLKSSPKDKKSLTLPRQYLKYSHWYQWIKDPVIEDSIMDPYKAFIQEINGHLSKVGRALGHRVWQSIERYMNNHPQVILGENRDSAIKIAFEDQLVQKVMPKLKGIETESHDSKNNCLAPIKQMLERDEYSIVEDFENACNLGYGQFNWCTAKYLDPDTSGMPEPSDTPKD